ncbi:hypothetical protein TrVE_jg7696 [Triparma verrucosa]|uniref:Uncharacterized protein n=2 Tax=Triparma TaxID=722752 RepID=A0A9W6ZHN1_9STRA|nr:hypothetical protein TrST_g10851 [Triparma strigata]GMI06336.1 hypothetical protein TrVE_jg7696 [Triparma verrucosa]
MNGAKRNSVTMGGSVHPLDNVLNDDLMNAGAKGGIVGRGKMMGDKAGVFEDSKLVNFGAAREKAMARMGDKLTPRSVFSSAVAGDEDEVYKLLCMEKVKIDERNPFNGRTLLHEAAAKGHLNMAEMLLIEFGANVNCRTYLGKETPLHLAVSQNNRSMVFLLLNFGADPNIQSKYFAAPLHYVQKKSIAVLLCRAGAKTTTRDIHNHTPVTTVVNEIDDCDDLVDFLTHVNIDQDRDRYKKEREANKAQRDEIERLKMEALSRASKGEKMSFKEKMQKEYNKWRKGDEDFLNEVERRKKLKAAKPNEYFVDEDWRKRPPKGHDPAAGEKMSQSQHWIE